jgi:hypothetical protein
MSPRPARVTHHCTITLRDGRSYTAKATTAAGHRPKAWKSIAMRAVPYGTDVNGCEFSRSVTPGTSGS